MRRQPQLPWAAPIGLGWRAGGKGPGYSGFRSPADFSSAFPLNFTLEELRAKVRGHAQKRTKEGTVCLGVGSETVRSWVEKD